MNTERIIPTGSLVVLRHKDIVPSPNNPRVLFDPEPLRDLRENIRQYGVLVPITVFRLPGSEKFGILDGARRHRCCEQLADENIVVDIPANVVEPPSKVAGLLYMFSIHGFREAWELMPTAMALKTIIDETSEHDTKKLSVLTGLSEPQVERCKVLLDLPAEFQNMSLSPDPKLRIPSNFWIEALPIVRKTQELLPKLFMQHEQTGLLRLLVDKYSAKKIKSVIHFRRIAEAIENSEGNKEKREKVVARLEKYYLDKNLETRQAFDEFVADARVLRSTVSQCDEFVIFLATHKVMYAVDLEKEQVTSALMKVRVAVESLLEKLKGEDAPSPNEGAEE